MDIEVLKSYLVDLGFQVNQPQLHKFDQALKEAAGMVESQTGGIAASLIKWQVGITSAFLAVTGGVVAMSDQVAMADQKYRLMGERMFMTTESARKLSIGMSLLGASMEEIQWDPELNANFLELAERQDRLTKQLGTGFADNMKSIRDLRQGFRDLQVDLQYLGMRFVSSLFERMGLSIEDVKSKLGGFSDWFEAHLPAIGDQLANFFVPILTDTWEILKSIGAAMGAVGLAFTNLVGALSGDTSIEGATLDFQKMGTAVLHVADLLADVANLITDMTGRVAHLVSGLALLFSGQWKAANDEGNAVFAPLPELMEARRNRLAKGGATSGGLAPSGDGDSDLAGQARQAALKAGAELGIDPKLIFEQWQHETGGFTNRGATQLNNFAGIRQGLNYRSFDSADDFADFYVNLLRSKRYTSQGILAAKNEDDFAGALKRGGYFEAPLNEYVNGMKGWGRQDSLSAGNGAQSLSMGDVIIHIDQPGASADEIHHATQRAIQDAWKQNAAQTQRNIAQLGFAG